MQGAVRRVVFWFETTKATGLFNITTMQPGIYPDLDSRDYHALPGASASRLRKLWQCTPGHLKAEMDAPREDAPEIGRAHV